MIDISGCNEDRSDEPSAGGAPYRYLPEVDYGPIGRRERAEKPRGVRFFAVIVKDHPRFSRPTLHQYRRQPILRTPRSSF